MLVSGLWDQIGIQILLQVNLQIGFYELTYLYLNSLCYYITLSVGSTPEF